MFKMFGLNKYTQYLKGKLPPPRDIIVSCFNPRAEDVKQELQVTTHRIRASL